MASFKDNNEDDVEEKFVFDRDVAVLETFAYDSSKFRQRDNGSIRCMQGWVVSIWAVGLGLSWTASSKEDKVFGLALMSIFLLVLEVMRCSATKTDYSRSRRVSISSYGIRKERRKSRGVSETIPELYAATVVRSFRAGHTCCALLFVATCMMRVSQYQCYLSLLLVPVLRDGGH